MTRRVEVAPETKDIKTLLEDWVTREIMEGRVVEKIGLSTLAWWAYEEQVKGLERIVIQDKPESGYTALEEVVADSWFAVIHSVE